VKSESLGHFLTKNPEILREDFENLEKRIQYLRSKKFDDAAIDRIIDDNPKWLSYS